MSSEEIDITSRILNEENEKGNSLTSDHREIMDYFLLLKI